MMQPLASVVIPTCNRPAMLGQCLDHLLRSIESSGASDVEVVVTDDSGTAETELLLRAHYPWVRWVAGPRRGPAHNRNFGVSQASGRWILFTDDDCLPTAEWVGAMLVAIRTRTGVRVLEGRTVADREPRSLTEEAPINLTGGYLWSCNMAIERQLFESLGGFCEEFPFPANEDTDLRLRVLKAGETFEFIPAATVCHPLRLTRGLQFQRRIAPSYLLLARRHPEVLGAAPWRTLVLNVMRRMWSVLVRGSRMRFRGVGFAVGVLWIQARTEVRAIAGRHGRT